MYLLFAILFIFIFYSAVNPRISPRDLLRFLIGASFSIIIMVLILLVLSGLGQGIVIIVNLFWDPKSMFLTILTVNFLALILSHFPNYLEIGIWDREGKLLWKKWPGNYIISLVYYEDPERVLKKNVFLSFFRRQLGLLTYVIWIYALVTVISKIYWFDMEGSWAPYLLSPDFLAGVFCGFFVVLHYTLESIEKDVDKLEVEDPVAHEKAVRKYLQYYLFLFWLNIVLIILFIILVNVHQMNVTNVILLFLLTFFNALLYVFFRVFRSWLKYFGHGDEDKPLAFKLWSIFPHQYLAETVPYLVLISLFGLIFSGGLIFFMYYSPFAVNAINPIVVFIILVLLYYSALVIMLKHYLYQTSTLKMLRKKDLPGRGWCRFLAVCYSLVPFLFIGYLVGGTFMRNDLHVLKTAEVRESIDVDAYLNDLPGDTTLKSYFLIGAYGGGLKADAWTMMILDHLRVNLGPDFLNSTLCMSGVSGGALGLGNYTMISRRRHLGEGAWIDDIRKVSEANVLSSDLTGWLFKDLMRETLWCSFDGDDRAHQSMLNYACLVDDAFAGAESFRSYWKEVYTLQNRRYPVVIINTTPTRSRYGVACSITGLDSFPIMIDILAPRAERSLTFLSAVSTSNRFPLFSPAAQIPGLGQFVDGGYFENSGLLNAQSFYHQVKDRPAFRHKKRDNVYAINIVNDKTNYILANEEIRKKMGNRGEQNGGSGEFISIIQGIAALERMPNYVREQIDNYDTDIDLISLQMPYLFDLDDIKAVYKTNKLEADEFKEIIDSNRAMILQALRDYGYNLQDWGVVEPPLGRLLSVPAVDYQQAMIRHHPEIRKTIMSVEQKIQ